MTTPAHVPAPCPYHRRNPFLAELTEHRRLSRRGSEKDTRHFVLNLAGSGLTYRPGDSLGVYARNSPALVDEIIEVLGFAPGVTVKDLQGEETSLRQSLLLNYILNRANRKIMSALAERISQGEQRNELMELVDNDDLLADYLYTRDYVDILREFDEARFAAPEDFLSQLTPIPPRLYSIASSLAAHPDEAHLCVAVVRYETHGRKKTGLASGFLGDHSQVGQCLPVYVQEARHFGLPADGSRDLIMCGPGTGIAPFRAFLEQRLADGATGRHWLIFGAQRRAADFLYGDEWLAYQRQGKLHRLDLAFSRDQAGKIYVQHRIRENAKELWAWLQRGAYFYVCGDAKQMAKDVHQAVLDIAQAEGGLSVEAAADYVNTTLMKTEKRYLRDVY
jgi:sulfite reductase (NADPH) flavoprotein alpha-component